MAAKTAQVHGRIFVASIAELPLGINRNGSLVCRVAHMTFDAPGKTVLGGTNSIVNRLVTLVLDHLHVVASHELCGLNAAVELRSL
jgi:hypothetical protein